MIPKVGDKVLTWFSDMDDGKSMIVAVRPYDGKYKDDYKYWVTLTAPRTRARVLEMPQ